MLVVAGGGCSWSEGRKRCGCCGAMLTGERRRWGWDERLVGDGVAWWLVLLFILDNHTELGSAALVRLFFFFMGKGAG